MQVNLRGAESPVRSRLQAFADICPSVPEFIAKVAAHFENTDAPLGEEARDLLKRMEQPS